MRLKVSEENRKKLEYLLIPAGVLLVLYLFFQYIFPLIWPLALSAGLAVLFYPVVRFFHKKLHLNKIVSIVLLLILFILVLVVGIALVMERLIGQVQLFTAHMEEYGNYLIALASNTCLKVEKTFGLENGCILDTLNDGLQKFLRGISDNLMDFVIGTSIPAVRTIVNMLIVAAVMIVAFFLLMKDMEKLKEKTKESVFRQEAAFFYHRFLMVFKAYFRAQVVIMAVVAAISILGFTIVGNHYAWLVGILVGILDALPLLGAGIVLIPMTLIYAIQGNMVKAAIIFTAFMACYFAREILEPKLMGKRMGVGPFTTLAGIYIGYRLFGFAGMFAGVFTVILLSDVLHYIKEKKVL